MRSNLSFGDVPARRVWLPYLVLMAALLLTGALIFLVQRDSATKSQHEFEVAADETKLKIETRLESCQALLRGTSGLFSANELVNRSQFQAYVARLKIPNNYRGIQGIGYSVRIPAQEKERVVASMKRQGVSNFHIWPAHEASEYHVVVYLEPTDVRNQRAIGYDMFTDPTRRAAIERARDEGFDAATGKVRLVQETDQPGQAGFLIYTPVYRGGSPPAVADRRAALQGFVHMAFRVDDLAAGILGQTPDLPLGLEIYDGMELKGENLLHRSSGLQGALRSRPRFQKQTTLDVAGRKWTLAFYSLPRPPASSERMLVSLIAIGGVMLSLVLFYFTLAEGRARSAAERSNLELQQSEAALRQSEQRLSAIFNQATAGIAQTDMTGRFVLVNRKYCDLVGRSMKEVLSMRMQDVTHPDDLPPNLELFNRLATGGPSFTIQKRYVRPDGSWVWVNNSVSVLTNVAGEPNYVVAISHDITDRKRAEEALQEESHTLEVINRIGTALAAELNLERLLQAVTDAGTEITGAKFGAFIYNVATKTNGPTTLYGLSGLDREEFEKFASAGNEAALRYPAEGVVRIDDVLKDSRYAGRTPFQCLVERDLAVRSYLATPVISRSGEVLGGLFFAHGQPGVFTTRSERVMVGIAAQAAIAIDNARLFQAAQTEIAERKRAEEALRFTEERVRQLNLDLEKRVLERTAQLEASNKELEAFCYSVSHDLRAPLRSIDGFNQALLEEYHDKLDERGKEYLQRARGAGHRMGLLIDDMLHLSRLSRSEMVRQHVNLSESARSIAGELQKGDGSRRVEFVISPRLMAYGDERLLRIALENLLGNAWKFTSKREQARIEFGVEEQRDGKVAYFVRDNGAGFDMAYVHKLFGVFQRLHATSEFPGTGIGLATVQRIIHRHGGQIWAMGEPDKGTSFYFTLP